MITEIDFLNTYKPMIQANLRTILQKHDKRVNAIDVLEKWILRIITAQAQGAYNNEDHDNSVLPQWSNVFYDTIIIRHFFLAYYALHNGDASHLLNFYSKF